MWTIDHLVSRLTYSNISKIDAPGSLLARMRMRAARASCMRIAARRRGGARGPAANCARACARVVPARFATPAVFAWLSIEPRRKARTLGH